MARQEWWAKTWPEIVRLAQEKGALILFGDEVSFARWGSLARTWARVGQQPVVKTSGWRTDPVKSVNEALAHFAQQAAEIQALIGLYVETLKPMMLATT